MRSRAEWRRGAEWLARLAALGLLGWALYASAVARRPSAATALSTTHDTAAAITRLRAWSADPALARIHITLAAAPDELTREWLRALDRAGTRVSWGGRVPATAIVVEPVADPRGAVRVAVAAPDRLPVVVADGAGTIDSLVPRGGGVALRVPALAGQATARVGVTIARAALHARRTTRSVIVIGAAGWEAKFVAAALEEQGWPVTVRMRVAPGLSVGGAAALDTARVSAVVALDSTAASDAGAIAAFVRSGGGLVLAAGASRVAALAAVAPARAGTPVRAAATFAAAVAPVTREALSYAPLVSLLPDAVVLERRGAIVLAAARRVEAGRVVQLGYDETWRWRMAGGDDAPDAHRAWWSQVVEAVAYAPVVADSAAVTPAAAADPAPRAALIAALGDSIGAPLAAASHPPFDPSRSLWVYLSAVLLLLAEWASRRLRGAK